jgi:hypothetical protein
MVSDSLGDDEALQPTETEVERRVQGGFGFARVK